MNNFQVLVRCYETIAQNPGFRHPANFRLWLDSDLPTRSRVGLECPQHRTFDQKCPLHPQVRTFLAVPSFVWFWLQADLQPPEIDFRFAPISRHSRSRH